MTVLALAEKVERASSPRAGTALENALLVGGCCAALATLVPVALHQFGVLPHLPDPPGGLFASDRITMSRTAHPLGVPDSVPGLASYGATLALAVLAVREEEPGVASTLLGAKLALDAAAAGFNAVRQVVVFGKLCSWCTGTALATGVMVWGGRRFAGGLARGVARVSKS